MQLCYLSMSGEVEICSAVRFCWYFSVDMIENSGIKIIGQLHVQLQYPLFFC
jgi:hypothetical protein